MKSLRFSFVLAFYQSARRLCRGVLEGTHPRKIKIDIPNSFPEFAPASAGNYLQKTKFTISSIKNTFESLSQILITEGYESQVIESERFSKVLKSRFSNQEEIAKCFNKFGSAKSISHSYQYIYGPIFSDIRKIDALLEIGLGTNDTKVLSNMSKWGIPGASLRAFQELLPQTKIYGADIDKKILFTEDRIETFFVDQTKFETLLSLGKKINGQLDIIIDDGLHSPEANLNVIRFAHEKLKVGGWLVIEDISSYALPMLRVLSFLIRDSWLCYIIKDNQNLVFVGKKRK